MNAVADNYQQHVDMLIIGAGISGLGMGVYLRKQCPQKTFLMLEARQSVGGTWDLFRYPGIRSDSDLHTFGYEFKPWTEEKSIASAASILNYLKDTAREYKLEDNIRFGHTVISANWCSDARRWTVLVRDQQAGIDREFIANWIFCAAGYYKYDAGFTPDFNGLDQFKGQVVHPQQWPENLDYTNKKVVVIGSGATAVTLIPAMADKVEHITMLQRTPTYIMSLPAKDKIANKLKEHLPAQLAYNLVRRKNIFLQRAFWTFCQRFPDAARNYIRKHTLKQLPAGVDVDIHFKPPYNPWDQRLCAVPNGDLFKTLRSGKASIVTDHVQSFTEDGITLKSGKHLPADIVVTATGLNIHLMGGIQLSMDGAPVQLNDKVAFKGMMVNDVPNFAFAIGYTNSSWTLKIGLICEHLCRLLNHMDKKNLDQCMPVLPTGDFKTRPLLDFGAGYVQRALDSLPRQGLAAPWTMSMSFYADEKILRKGAVTDRCLSFKTRQVGGTDTPASLRAAA